MKFLTGIITAFILFLPTPSSAAYPVFLDTLFFKTVSAHTASYSVTFNDTKGKMFTNLGAPGDIRFDLPDITKTGQIIRISVAATEDIDINPDDSDTILVFGCAAGDAISSDKIIGSSVCLISVSTTQWMPYYVGVWTDVN